MRAEVVVDASGQSSMIMSRLGLREWDPVLKKAALWTYWEGAYRDTGRDEGATLVLQTEGKKGWFWYIPLHDDIVSVGVVAAYDYLFKNRGTTRTTRRSTSRKSTAARACSRGSPTAKRVRQFFAARRSTPTARKQAAGDGWVLVGDAFGFLDPLYSSGVLLALKSGQLAADAIAEGLAKGDTSAAQLGKWEAEFVARHGPHAAAGVRVLRRLQLRPVRQAASAPEGAPDRPADRRPVQGRAGRGVRS